MTEKAKQARKLVLVVDDSATVRHAVCGILERLELRVAEAEDGDGALKAMANEKPDLVILDIHMPVKGGIETLKEMRAHLGYTHIPVFILTSAAGSSYVEQAVAHGISGYLVKSELNPTDLADRIGTVLGKIAARPKKLQRSLGLKVLLGHGPSGDQRGIIGILADWGCTVMPTDSAQEAVELMAGEPPDLVLIEDQLTDKDGFETAKTLRERDPGARVPVILMTNSPIEEIRELGAAAGMDAYIAKPVESDRLYKTLTEIQVLKTGSGDAGDGDALFDRAELMERAGDEIELAQRMLSLFFRDMPGLMEKTAEGISAADTQLVGDSAHTIKGMLATLAASEIAATAARLEEAGRGSQFKVAKSELAVLGGEIERLSLALKSEFKLT